MRVSRQWSRVEFSQVNRRRRHWRCHCRRRECICDVLNGSGNGGGNIRSGGYILGGGGSRKRSGCHGACNGGRKCGCVSLSLSLSRSLSRKDRSGVVNESQPILDPLIGQPPTLLIHRS